MSSLLGCKGHTARVEFDAATVFFFGRQKINQEKKLKKSR